ncbi:hypothetical protein [Psychromonas ossibalaenae]|uniref:hypothetical protein n=1 Tax=Psychromonas ossibalaenae TaxID=444922 RepID=UPI000366DB74|nr:hypothetical protein [Psychromonas ossibalaenae]
MKARSFIFIFLLACFFASTANSQVAMFSGWDQFCGIRVISVSNPQGASASIDQIGPVIYADPSVLGNWSMSRVFTLAHECGHHMNGHVTPQGMWFRKTQFWATRDQELQSDCWAARALSRSKNYADLDRTIRQFASQGLYMQGNYPSGLERAQTIARCGKVNFDFTPFLPATFCATNYGPCQLFNQISKGSQCFCQTPQGQIWGIAR